MRRQPLKKSVGSLAIGRCPFRKLSRLIGHELGTKRKTVGKFRLVIGM
jgi:hypothetical protein